MESINLARLQSETEAIQTARVAANEFSGRDIAAEYLDKPKDLEPISSDPWSAETVNRIRNVWSSLEIHNKFDRTRLINNARYRRSIMLSHMLAWEWLDVTARNRCIQIHRHSDVGTTCWFDLLVGRVDALVLTNIRNTSISATDFTSELNVEPYQWNRTDNHSSFSESEREKFVVEKCLDIIGGWLGYERDSAGLAQAWYIRYMVRATNDSVLYLKRVHEGYMRLKSEVMGDRRMGKIYKTDFKLFIEDLALHPLADPHSQERMLLENIACAVESRGSLSGLGLHTL